MLDWRMLGECGINVRYIMKHPPKNQKIMGKKAEVEKTLGGGRKIKKSKRDEDDLEKQRLRKVIDESELLYSKPEGTVFL